jgi:hypothetical protein
MKNQVFPIVALFFSRDNPMPIAFFLSTALYQQLHLTIGIRRQKFSIPKTNKNKISRLLSREYSVLTGRELYHTHITLKIARSTMIMPSYSCQGHKGPVSSLSRLLSSFPPPAKHFSLSQPKPAIADERHMAISFDAGQDC